MRCEGQGKAVAFALSQGQRHDSKLFQVVLDEGLLSASRMGANRPDKLAADKAYRAKHILDRLESEEIEAVIPAKSNEKPKSTEKRLDKAAYRQRNVVERLIGWLKQWRAVATRYDKLARNYGATVTLAPIERSLRGEG